MKYKIAMASSATALESYVNRLMKEHGWEPLGGAAVITWIEHDECDIQCFEYSQVLINQSEL